MAATPDTRFARVDELDIAYQVLGEGPPDLLMGEGGAAAATSAGVPSKI